MLTVVKCIVNAIYFVHVFKEVDYCVMTMHAFDRSVQDETMSVRIKM